MSYKANWWRKFYKSSWQITQPSSHTFEQTKQEADFVEKVINYSSKTKILDIPCGDGRLSLELASRGYQVEGVDFNKNFLKLAKENALKKNLTINWYQKDMRQIQWKNQFDAVICMWTSFGYFKDEENFKFIAAVSQALRKNGCFLLDIQTVETLYPRFQSESQRKINDVNMMIKRSIDLATARLEENFTFIHKKKKSKYHSSIRLYTYKEITELLKQNGFGGFKAYGTLAKDNFNLGSTRLLLISKKIVK